MNIKVIFILSLMHITSNIIRFFKHSTASVYLPRLTSLTAVVYALITSLKATQSYKLIRPILSMLILWTIIQILSPFPYLAIHTFLNIFTQVENFFHLRNIYLALHYMPNLYPKCWALHCSNNYHGNLLNVYLAQILSH